MSAAARIAGSNSSGIINVYVVCRDKGTSQDNQDKETVREKVQSENKKRTSVKMYFIFSKNVRTGCGAHPASY
jgi:hypothetical protein